MTALKDRPKHRANSVGYELQSVKQFLKSLDKAEAWKDFDQTMVPP